MMGDAGYGLDFVGNGYVPKMGDMPSFQLYFWNKMDQIYK